jgi:hypothetical protein
MHEKACNPPGRSFQPAVPVSSSSGQPRTSIRCAFVLDRQARRRASLIRHVGSTQRYASSWNRPSRSSVASGCGAVDGAADSSISARVVSGVSGTARQSARSAGAPRGNGELGSFINAIRSVEPMPVCTLMQRLRASRQRLQLRRRSASPCRGRCLCLWRFACCSAPPSSGEALLECRSWSAPGRPWLPPDGDQRRRREQSCFTRSLDPSLAASSCRNPLKPGCMMLKFDHALSLVAACSCKSSGCIILRKSTPRGCMSLQTGRADHRDRNRVVGCSHVRRVFFAPGSRWSLQRRASHARGGLPTEENLALRCRAHNALAAEEDFGRKGTREKRGVSDPRQRGEFDRRAGAWSG